MKNIIKYYWIAFIVLIINTSTPSMAQKITTPTETRKQAQIAIKADQKREKIRRKEAKNAKEETEENNEKFLEEKVPKNRKGKRSKPAKESRKRGIE